MSELEQIEARTVRDRKFANEWRFPPVSRETITDRERMVAALKSVLNICDNEYSSPEGGSSPTVSRDAIRAAVNNFLEES